MASLSINTQGALYNTLVAKSRLLEPSKSYHPDVVVNKTLLDACTATVTEVWNKLKEISLQMKECGFAPNNVKFCDPDTEAMVQYFLQKVHIVLDDRTTRLAYGSNLTKLRPVLDLLGSDRNLHNYTNQFLQNHEQELGPLKSLGQKHQSIFQGLSLLYTRDKDRYELHFRTATLFAQMALIDGKRGLSPTADISWKEYQLDALRTLEHDSEFVPTKFQLEVIPIITGQNLEIIHPLNLEVPNCTSRQAKLGTMYKPLSNNLEDGHECLLFQLSRGTARSAKYTKAWKADSIFPLLWNRAGNQQKVEEYLDASKFLSIQMTTDSPKKEENAQVKDKPSKNEGNNLKKNKKGREQITSGSYEATMNTQEYEDECNNSGGGEIEKQAQGAVTSTFNAKISGPMKKVKSIADFFISKAKIKKVEVHSGRNEATVVKGEKIPWSSKKGLKKNEETSMQPCTASKVTTHHPSGELDSTEKEQMPFDTQGRNERCTDTEEPLNKNERDNSNVETLLQNKDDTTHKSAETMPSPDPSLHNNPLQKSPREQLNDTIHRITSSTQGEIIEKKMENNVNAVIAADDDILPNCEITNDNNDGNIFQGTLPPISVPLIGGCDLSKKKNVVPGDYLTLRNMLVKTLDRRTDDPSIVEDIRDAFGKDVCNYFEAIMDTARGSSGKDPHVNMRKHIFQGVDDVSEMPAIAAFYLTAAVMIKHGGSLGQVKPPNPKGISIQGCNLKEDCEYQDLWTDIPKKNKMKRRHHVVQTAKNGNCLLNSICLGSYGSQDREVVERLRWFIVRDMVLNGNEYLDRPESVTIGSQEAGPYIQETMRLLRLGAHLSAWHIFAAANVLNINIDEYHPQYPNALTFPKPAKDIKRTYMPISGCAMHTISILDCGYFTPFSDRMRKEAEEGNEQSGHLLRGAYGKGTFTMDHYSSLIPQNGLPGRPKQLVAEGYSNAIHARYVSKEIPAEIQQSFIEVMKGNTLSNQEFAEKYLHNQRKKNIARMAEITSEKREQAKKAKNSEKQRQRERQLRRQRKKSISRELSAYKRTVIDDVEVIHQRGGLHSDGSKSEQENSSTSSNPSINHSSLRVKKKMKQAREGDDLSSLKQPLSFEQVLEKFESGTPKDHVGEGDLSHSGHLIKAGIIARGTYKRRRHIFYHDQAGVYSKTRGRSAFYLKREVPVGPNSKGNEAFKYLYGSALDSLRDRSGLVEIADKSKVYKATQLTYYYLGKRNPIPHPDSEQYKTMPDEDLARMMTSYKSKYSFQKIVHSIRQCNFTEDEDPWKNTRYVEYIGEQPKTPSAHGNQINPDIPYIRDFPKVLHDLGLTVMEDGKTIKDTYMNNVLEDSSELFKIQSMKKLRDHVYKLRQQKKLRPDNIPHNVLASDELKLIARYRSETDPESAFIQSISFPDRTEPAMVICFHKKNMKRLATYISKRENVVLGIDRTFSVSTHFVTTLTLSVDNFRRPNSSANPTFAMAYMLHTKATVPYYTTFLAKLKHSLQKEGLDIRNNSISFGTSGPEELYSDTEEVNLNRFIIGSDQEQAITNAIEEVFPNRPYILCLLHLKKNCLSNLTTKCKTSPQERKHIMKSIYHMSEGLMGVQTASSLDLMLAEILEEYEERPDLRRYITLAASKIRDHAVVPFLRQNRVIGWCNNGNESVNASLKRALEWRQVPVIGLVEKLEQLSAYEQKEIQRMLCGRGEFQVSKICRNLRFDSIQNYHACPNKEK